MINCISNIAWSFNETKNVFSLLKENKIEYIEVAPLEIINDWNNPDLDKLKEFKKLLDDFEIKIKSFQSIFYKKKIDLTKDYKKVINHLELFWELFNIFECNYIVIGSPKNRPSTLGRKKSEESFFNFMSELNYLRFGIEAAPKEYGGNFLTNYEQVNNFVLKSMLKNCFIHFDTGCDSFEESNFLKLKKSKITNIHYSKQYLCTPIKFTNTEKQKLNFLGKRKIISLEMKKSLDNIKSIKNVIYMMNQGLI